MRPEDRNAYKRKRRLGKQLEQLVGQGPAPPPAPAAPPFDHTAWQRQRRLDKQRQEQLRQGPPPPPALATPPFDHTAWQRQRRLRAELKSLRLQALYEGVKLAQQETSVAVALVTVEDMILNGDLDGEAGIHIDNV
jgi:hypothetical protein